MDLGSIIITLASLLGGGGAVLFLREWQWLRHCRYIHDQAVLRGQDPDPAVMIEVAHEGRPNLVPRKKPALPAAPKSTTTKTLAV